MAEIELKFVTRQSVLAPFMEKVIPALQQQGMGVSKATEMRLQNDYYDTQEHEFQARKMGFRVRGNNGEFEQTLKTHGKVSGGLHERAEHNVALSKDEPDLTLFDASVWPQDLDIKQLAGRLERQFSTHFTRTAFDIQVENTVIELVLDEGEVITGKAQSPIHEIELELKSGDVGMVFTIARIINEVLPVRLSDVSKAAQGYQLLHGIQAQVTSLPAFLPLDRNCSTEEAFATAMRCALAHWQRHEHLFMETGSIKMLAEVAKSLRLMLQSVSLYLPVLQCPAMLALHKQLLNYAQEWLWQDDLQSLRYLLSKKSLFNKNLARHPSLLSYLQGRKAGLLQAHNPENLFFETTATSAKLSASAILHNRPWRKEAKGYDMPVMEHAKGWLSQGWQTVQQSMPVNRDMAAANYTAIEILLRQTLWNGFLLADLFVEEQGTFRAPWLDLLTGIDELRALLMLRHTLKEAEPEAEDELEAWVDEKTQSLLKVMERTRQVAMRGDVYW